MRSRSPTWGWSITSRPAGIFLVLEGIEGSGKSTQAGLLADALRARGASVLLVREPGHTPAGEDIRRILLHGEALPATAELFLLLAARAVLVAERIRPALARGEVVIADRFELSTLAYQGYGRGLPVEEIRGMNALATGGTRPDLTIVLGIPGAVGEARRELAGKQPDRIERAGASFHERVAEAYALLASSGPAVAEVDGQGSPGEVHTRILQLVLARFPETFLTSRVT